MTEGLPIKFIPVTLDDFKRLKYEAIDEKTVSLIRQGFDYTSKKFSMSEVAQINWLGMKQNKTLFIYPLQVTTKNNDVITLASEAEVESFVQSALMFKLTILKGGSDLKKLVHDATTVEQVDAVVDNR